MDGSRRFHRGAFRCHGWPLLAPSCAAVLLAFAIDPTDPGVVPDALASADGNPPAAQLPYAEHPVMNNSYECCGWLTNESSEFYETAFAWQFDGCTAEGAGAFAQRLVLPRKGTICCALFDFTMVRGEPSQPADVYVFADAEIDGNPVPGEVLAITAGWYPGSIAWWPSLSRHNVDIDGPCVEGAFWVGFAGTWYGAEADYFIGGDLHTGSGEAMTLVASGLDYPSGWQPISAVWEPVGSLGIAVEFDPDDCELSPVHQTSWGQIKRLYEAK